MIVSHADLIKRLEDLKQGREQDPLDLADTLENFASDIRSGYWVVVKE